MSQILHPLAPAAALVVLAGCASTAPQATVAGDPASAQWNCPAPSSRTVVPGAVLARANAPSLTEALAGRVAGLTVGIDRGRRVVSIRGRSSFQRVEPLVVVDEAWQTQRGSQALDRVNVHDIALLEVLKDSDASARYGSEGGAGVITITTRRAGCDAPRPRGAAMPADRPAAPRVRPAVPVLPPVRRT